jgi:hypothetical protein
MLTMQTAFLHHQCLTTQVYCTLHDHIRYHLMGGEHPMPQSLQSLLKHYMRYCAASSPPTYPDIFPLRCLPFCYPQPAQAPELLVSPITTSFDESLVTVVSLADRLSQATGAFADMTCSSCSPGDEPSPAALNMAARVSQQASGQCVVLFGTFVSKQPWQGCMREDRQYLRCAEAALGPEPVAKHVMSRSCCSTNWCHCMWSELAGILTCRQWHLLPR